MYIFAYLQKSRYSDVSILIDSFLLFFIFSGNIIDQTLSLFSLLYFSSLLIFFDRNFYLSIPPSGVLADLRSEKKEREKKDILLYVNNSQKKESFRYISKGKERKENEEEKKNLDDLGISFMFTYSFHL